MISRPPSSVVHRLSFVVHTLKHLLLRNRLTNQSQISYEPPWDGGTKVCSNGPGHMTKMAAMPIYGKILKNLLLRNQKADDLESWYATLGVKYYQFYSSNGPELTLAYFMAKQIWSLMLLYGKKVKQ